jgi:hypothetical protein
MVGYVWLRRHEIWEGAQKGDDGSGIGAKAGVLPNLHISDYRYFYSLFPVCVEGDVGLHVIIVYTKPITNKIYLGSFDFDVNLSVVAYSILSVEVNWGSSLQDCMSDHDLKRHFESVLQVT